MRRIKFLELMKNGIPAKAGIPYLALLLLVLASPHAAHAQRVDQLPMLRQQKMMQAPAQQPAAPQSSGPVSSGPMAPMGAPTMVPMMAAAAVPPPVDERIVAVVNENVITTTDVENRIKIALLSSGLPDTPEVREKLLPQILRALIDEQLQLQEAKKIDVSVTKEDVNAALERIAHDNNIPIDMRTYVVAHGISPAALEDQIKAGLTWSRVVQRELRPRVEIGDDEIQAVLDRVRANAGKQEYLTSEIFLAVDNPKDEDQVRQFADNLVQQLKSGANFGAVARQFSQGAGAATGGDIGWIQEGQLSPELSKAMVAINPGEITTPIRTSNGYHILGVREKRTVSFGNAKDISLDLQQAFRPFSANDDKQALLEQAVQIRKTVTSCDALKTTLSQKFTGWTWQDMGSVKLDRAPSWLAENVRNLSIGSGGEPIATDKGALIVFLCGKHVPDEAANRDSVMNLIGTEKLELQARRLLRDLRRAAYIDIRIGKDPT